MSVSVSFNPYQCDLSKLTVRLLQHFTCFRGTVKPHVEELNFSVYGPFCAEKLENYSTDFPCITWRRIVAETIDNNLAFYVLRNIYVHLSKGRLCPKAMFNLC